MKYLTPSVFALFIFALSISCFLGFSAYGDQSDSLTVPELANWVTGPARVDIGDYATISIPDGYRFARGNDAKLILKARNNTASDSLVGILAPTSGRWFVIFEYSRIGFIGNQASDSLDADVILKTVREKIQAQIGPTGSQGDSQVATVTWAMKPSYDPTQHSMEWSIRAQNSSGQTINHVVRLFSREGMLDGIAVQPEQLPSDTIPLKSLMAGISFKPGFAYSDYREGDKVSSLSLAELITADTSIPKYSIPQTLLFSIAGVVVIGLGVGAWFIKNRGKKNSLTTAREAPMAVNHSKSNRTLSTSAKNGSRSILEAKINGNHNGNLKLRRKKVFDYQKYYSDLLFQVSDRAYDVSLPQPGHDKTAYEAKVNPLVTADSNTPTLSANLKLIESQRHLIDEQQRLIREQTRLIEEKTKLIQEKNQVLEKQSELFGNQVF